MVMGFSIPACAPVDVPKKTSYQPPLYAEKTEKKVLEKAAPEMKNLASKDPAKLKQITGDVVAVNAKANTITVKGKKGDYTTAVDDETRIIMGKEIKTLADIKVGDKVLVKFTEADGKMTANRIAIKDAEKQAVPVIKKAEKKAEPAEYVKKTEPVKPAEKIDKNKDVSPPEIIITSHNTRGIDILLKEKMTTIKGLAIDSSGVAEVTVNNKEAKLDKDGNFRANVLLKVGNNIITVSAMDTYGNNASKSFIITRENQMDTVASPAAGVLNGWYQKQYAVVIGIDRYQNHEIDALQNAVNDAKAVAGMFRKLGFDVKEFYNEQATRKAILSTFSNIISTTGKNDSFILYFAGHGQGLTLDNNERVGYIIPYDADINLQQTDIVQYDEEAIALKTIEKYAKDIKAKHIAMLYDSCFSGLAMGHRSYALPDNINTEYYQDLLKRKAINILTAGDDQRVSDGTGHSPFTQAILNALEKNGIDMNDRDGYATFKQLAVYVKEKVEKGTNRRQRPQFDDLSLEDGDFVFRVK
jgi:hypothetical protein